MLAPTPTKIVEKKTANAISLVLNIIVFLRPADGVNSRFAWRQAEENRSESSD